MVNLLTGLNGVRDALFDDITHGQLGTGGTAPTENDTGLETPDATTSLVLSNKVKSQRSLRLTYELPSSGGTASTYREFLLFNNSTNVNYFRDVFTGISFTSGGTQDLVVSKTILIRGL